MYSIKKMSLLLCISIQIFYCRFVVTADSEALEGAHTKLVLVQVLKDGIDGVDGLDNPRFVKISTDNTQLFVASGDDNSFAVFTIDDEFTVSFNQVFKNSDPDIKGLEGASSVAFISNNKVVVTGYYDGALTIFSPNNTGYQYSQMISDGLSYKRSFDSELADEKLDILGLLGAWEVIATNNNKQLLVASYISNAVSIFDIASDDKIVFNHSIKNGMYTDLGLGRPAGLALSPSNNELYVLGFEGNKLTIFARDKIGTYVAKQVLKNGVDGVKQFVNPQKIVVSPSGKHLYVACSGSHSIVVFNKTEEGQYTFLQAMTRSYISGLGLNGEGLNGASSLAMSLDGLTLYAAGETGIGLTSLEVLVDGRLQIKNQFSNKMNITEELTDISSITLSAGGRHLLVTTATSDSLIVFEIIAD
jgi:6-phosphogluconolactonase (cycloisomerase 2 family)